MPQLAIHLHQADTVCSGPEKISLTTPAGFTQFLKWLSPYGSCHICLEVTGNYSIPLATFLADNGINVSAENPSRIHGPLLFSDGCSNNFFTNLN